MKAIKVPATLEGVSTLKDGSMSIRFHTQELNSDEKVTIINFVNGFGWLLFDVHESIDLPKESPHREAGDKTPSQRLRAVLYVLWQKKYSDIPFDVWYQQQVEKIISSIKERIK